MFAFLTADDAATTLPELEELLDFSHAQDDRIDLSALDADSVTTGDQAFAWIDDAAFSGTRGELRLEDRHLLGDTDGDRAADLELILRDVMSLDFGTDIIA